MGKYSPLCIYFAAFLVFSCLAKQTGNFLSRSSVFNKARKLFAMQYAKWLNSKIISTSQVFTDTVAFEWRFFAPKEWGKFEYSSCLTVFVTPIKTVFTVKSGFINIVTDKIKTPAALIRCGVFVLSAWCSENYPCIRPSMAYQTKYSAPRGLLSFLRKVNFYLVKLAFQR